MIAVRPARPDDASAIEVLLAQLGYHMPADDLRERLAALASSRNDATLIAVKDGPAIGLIALHWSTMLHQPGPTARITTLVVGDNSRGHGVGRRLVEAAADIARTSGCTILELTTALDRRDARAFYEALGFTASSIRLHRML